MTEAEFEKLIATKSAKQVLKKLADLPANERRAFAKPAMKLFRLLDGFWVGTLNMIELGIKDGEAVTIAVLATASGSEMKKLSFFPMPGKIPIDEIIRKLQPDWTQSVVEHFIDDRTFYVDRLRPLWETGLCERPTSDAIILAYYSRWFARRSGVDEDKLLSGDVWRFFEVEGGGEAWPITTSFSKPVKKAGQIG